MDCTPSNIGAFNLALNLAQVIIQIALLVLGFSLVFRMHDEIRSSVHTLTKEVHSKHDE